MTIRSFIEALPAIANALGDSFGVQIITGSHACTNGKQIILPPLDIEKPESKVLGLGYTVHESSHVRYTDFDIVPTTSLEKHVANILEDVRIEKLMTMDFPGTGSMLNDLFAEMLKQGKFGNPEESTEPTQIMLGHMLYGLRYHVLRQEAFAEYADKADELSKQLPQGMLTRLNVLMFKVEECESTADVHSLAKSIITMMKDEAKKEEEKSKQEQQEKSESQDKDPADQQQQSQSQSGNRQTGDSQDQGKQNDQKDGQEGQGDDTGKQDSQSDPNSPQQQEAGQEGGSDGSGASDEAPSPEAEAIRSILGAGDDDWADAGETLAQMLDGEANHGSPSAVSPFRPVKSNEADADSAAAKARIAGASNSLRHKMQTLLQARTYAIKRSTSFGTKLNFKNLHRAPLLGPVFEKIKEGKAVDTAIALLVDISGSMSGNEELALDAALATMTAFQRPDVATAAFAFPHPRVGDANAVLKMWQEQPSAAIRRNMTMVANGGTPMAQAMFGAGIEICKRKEKRKIIFVLTDGDPDDKAQAHYVIDKARNTGIEVLGLGISHDVTKMFGKKHSGRIDNIDTLPQTMISMLEQYV